MRLLPKFKNLKTEEDKNYSKLELFLDSEYRLEHKWSYDVTIEKIHGKFLVFIWLKKPFFGFLSKDSKIDTNLNFVSPTYYSVNNSFKDVTFKSYRDLVKAFNKFVEQNKKELGLS